MKSSRDLEAIYRDVLLDLALLANARESVADVFAEFAERLLEGASFDYASLVAYETDRRFVRIIGSYPAWTRPESGEDVFLDRYIGVSAIREHEEGVEYVPAEVDLPSIRALEEGGIRRVWTVPLVHQGESYGAFTVGRVQPGPFEESTLDFLRAAARLLAAAVREEHHLARARQAAARSTLLNELAILLNEGESIEVIFDRLSDLLGQALSFDYITLVVADVDDGFLRRVGSRPALVGPPGSRLSYSDAQLDQLRATGQSVVEYRADRVEGVSTGMAAAHGIKRMLSAFLQQGDGTLGLLTIGRRTNLAFNADDVAFMELVATILSQAVANRLRLARIEADSARSRILNELAVMLNAGETADDLFEGLPDLLHQVMDFDYTSFLVATGRESELRLVGSEPFGVPPSEHTVTFDGANIARILATGSAITQYRTARVQGDGPAALQGLGIDRVLAVALQQGDETLGLFVLGRTENTPFSEEDVAFVTLVTTLLRHAVAHHLRVDRIEATAARNELLNHLAVLLNEGERIDALFGKVPDLLRKALSFDFVGLLAVAPDRRRLHLVGAEPVPDGFSQGSFSFQEAGLESLVDSGRKIVQNRPADYPDITIARLLAEFGIARAAPAVLCEGADILGILCVGRHDDARFSADEVAFVESVGTLLGQAIANRRRIERMEAQAHRGQLLNALAVLLNAGEPVRALFDRLRELVLQAVDADYVSLLARAGDDTGWMLIGSEPWIAFEQDTALTPREAGAEGLLAAGERVVQYRPEHVDLPVTRLLAGAGIGRVAAALLTGPDGALGILNLGRRPNVRFSSEDVAFIEVVATLLAQAVSNQRHMDATRHEAEEQRIIAEVAAAAARETDPSALTSALVEPVRSFVPMPFLAFSFREGDNGVFFSRLGSEVVPLTAVELRAFEEGQAAIAEFASHYPDGHPAAAFGLHALSETRSESGGAALGLLLIGSRQEGFVFRERELRLIRLIASIVGPAIASAVAAQRIASERAVYDLVLRSLSEAVIVFDEDFHTVFANAEGRRLVDAIDPDHSGRTAEAHLPAIPADARGAFLAAALGEARSRGRSALTVEGKLTSYDFELVPLDHPQYRLLVVASDVSAEVEREGERERHREEIEKASRLAALGELIGGVAHELNNPLTAILGFSELMADSPGVEPFAEEVDVIRKEATRASNIVRDLLFIARPGPVDRREVSVTDISGHIERLRRAAWNREGVTVTFDFDQLVGGVWGNEHQLTQVLLNLVTNAEHAIQGVAAPRIDISARTDGDTVAISVADNGHGMDAATQSRVFEPFFTTKQGYGTGLGLSLSYTIVTAHEGRIDLESEPGQGSRFTITLPARRTEDALLDRGLRPASWRPMRVLVVDDEPNLRKVCQRLIASMGHECDTADNAAETLRAVADRSYDLILCDYRLATETADAVVETLARIDPNLITKVVIATGATTDPGVIELTQRHQMRLIAKPYGVEEIAEVLACIEHQSSSAA